MPDEPIVVKENFSLTSNVSVPVVVLLLLITFVLAAGATFLITSQQAKTKSELAHQVGFDAGREAGFAEARARLIENRVINEPTIASEGVALANDLFGMVTQIEDQTLTMLIDSIDPLAKNLRTISVTKDTKFLLRQMKTDEELAKEAQAVESQYAERLAAAGYSEDDDDVELSELGFDAESFYPYHNVTTTFDVLIPGSRIQVIAAGDITAESLAATEIIILSMPIATSNEVDVKDFAPGFAPEE